MAERVIVDTGAAPFSINAPRPLGEKPTPAAERAKVAEPRDRAERPAANDSREPAVNPLQTLVHLPFVHRTARPARRAA